MRGGHDVLEIGTGTGYSTALACERLGDNGDVTSVEIDRSRLGQAARALYGCGYHPDLAVADGVYGYWPSAPFDRIVGHWASVTHDAPPRPVRHSPHRLDEATSEGLFGRFLAQLAAPDAQLVTERTIDQDILHMIDVNTGAAATLIPDHAHGHTVRQAGPTRLWDAVEAAWDAWDLAGRPSPRAFQMRVHNGRQSITREGANDLAFSLY
ncbi:hypothetical protein [Actinomadura sp. KC216]|uniref:hypothetical protein n=1 Tax=Actinomadura sp. KC216 TaxID=2530370 RepID=UPI00244173F9|nr:hypothetical protein [Actinomadura sp. KC216]